MKITLFIVMALTQGVAHAQSAAPLPDEFKPAGDVATVRGVFAVAMSWPRRYDFLDAANAAEAECQKKRAKTLQYEQGAPQGEQTTYWLYRSDTEAVVFERTVKPVLDAANCRVTFSDIRKVLRSVEEPGAWPSPFSSGKFKCRSSRGYKCYRSKVLGVKTRCESNGDGFTGTNYCVSAERGPTLGMLLISEFYSDDMNGFGFAVKELKPDVAIDASVFDKARTW